MIKKKQNIYEIAKAINVAPSTVSKAFSQKHYINPETRKKILQYAKKANYYPDSIAKSLSKGMTNNVGLVLLKKMKDIFINEFYVSMLNGIEQALLEQELNLLIYNYNINKEIPDFLFDKKTDGLIIIGNIPKPYWEKQLNRSFTPFLLVDNWISEKYISINTDNQKGVRLLFDHLLSLNHVQIGFAYGDLSEYSLNQRYKSFLSCLKSHQMLFCKKWMVQTTNTYEGGIEAAKEFLNKETLPTAIIFSNDAMAIGAIDYFHHKKLAIPDRISICGFDNINKAITLPYNLTTINVQKEKMGYLAVKVLVDLIQGERLKEKRIICSSELIIRNSTAPLKT